MFGKPKPLELESAVFLEEETEGVRSVPPENRGRQRWPSWEGMPR